MIFKTIDDDSTFSGQKLVGVLQARKIAQQQATAQLQIDIKCLQAYEAECRKGTVDTEAFTKSMAGASTQAQQYAANIKNGTGSAKMFETNQKAVQTSMTGTSIASKAAAVGLNVFKAALNSLIFFAVIEGIQLLVKGIDELILTADEAEEAAESLRSSMQTFFAEVDSNKKNISELSDRFEELSEGIGKSGENISLTEEEYSEFLDICNQVKGIMPELVSTYTAEGDAIVILTDKVNNLTEAYKNRIKAAAAAFISEGDENGNTIQSFFDDYKLYTEGEGGLFAPSASGAWNNKSTDYEDYYGYDTVHKWLSDVADLSLEDLQSKIDEVIGTTQATYLYGLLKENDLVLSEISAENYEQVHDILDQRLTNLEQEMSTRVSNIQMSLQQMLYADQDYWDIDDQNVLSAINKLFASVDDEFIKQNQLFSQTAAQAFESNVVGLFTNESTKQAMLDLYSLPNEDETVDDYVNRMKSAVDTVQSYCTKNGINIPISFEETTADVDTMISMAKGKLQNEFDNKVGELTLDELKIASELEVSEADLLSWDELIAKIKEVQSSTLDNESGISMLNIQHKTYNNNNFKIENNVCNFRTF